MKHTTTLIALCCGLFLLAACKKIEPVSDVAQKLMAGRWQIIASTYTTNYMGKDTTIDLYSGWRSCEQDDFMVFEGKGKGKANENTNKCPEDEQETEFSWQLQNNDTRLQCKLTIGSFVANDSNTIVSEILEITDTQLKLKSLDSSASNPPTIETYKNIR